MIKDIDILWCRNMVEDKKLSELSFGDAVIRENLLDRSPEELVKVTVHVPKWTRAAIGILHIDNKISEGRIFTAATNHGTAIIKNEFGDQINGMDETLRALLGSKNDLIVSIVTDFSISVNVVAGAGRRTMMIPLWCKSYLGQIGSNLRMDFSSVVRLALYCSLSRCETIDDHHLDFAMQEITNFRKKLDEYSSVCKQLVEIA